MFSCTTSFVPKISSIRSLRKNTIENYFNETKNLNIQIEKLVEQINQDSEKNRDFCEKEIKVALDKSKNKISKELKKMDEEFDKKKIHLSEELLKSKHLLKKKFQEYVLIYPINYMKEYWAKNQKVLLQILKK